MPYLMPTPTLGNALITRFTVVWSGNENMMDAKTDNQPYKYRLSTDNGKEVQVGYVQVNEI